MSPSCSSSSKLISHRCSRRRTKERIHSSNSSCFLSGPNVGRRASAPNSSFSACRRNSHVNPAGSKLILCCCHAVLQPHLCQTRDSRQGRAASSKLIQSRVSPSGSKLILQGMGSSSNSSCRITQCCISSPHTRQGATRNLYAKAHAPTHPVHDTQLQTHLVTRVRPNSSCIVPCPRAALIF